MKINKDTKLDEKSVFKLGSVIEYTYSYNAQYPNFGIITKITPKSVWFKRIPKKWVSHDGYGQNGLRVPDLDAYNEYGFDPNENEQGPFRIKKSAYDGKEFFKVSYNTFAYVWDGKPVNEYTD